MREKNKGEGAALLCDLQQYASGLVCLTGGDEGPLAAALVNGGEEAGSRAVKQLAQLFGRENVYVEVQRHQQCEEEWRYQAALRIAESLRLPVIATNGVRYGTAYGREVLDVLIEGVTNERDKLLFSLFLATGLRVSKLHQLNRDSIRIDITTNAIGEEEILGVGEIVGKGSKRRRFYVYHATLMLFAAYLTRREDKQEALFLSERRQRMSVRAIQYTLDIWTRRLGLEHINVHRLRHTPQRVWRTRT